MLPISKVATGRPQAKGDTDNDEESVDRILEIITSLGFDGYLYSRNSRSAEEFFVIVKGEKGIKIPSYNIQFINAIDKQIKNFEENEEFNQIKSDISANLLKINGPCSSYKKSKVKDVKKFIRKFTRGEITVKVGVTDMRSIIDKTEIERLINLINTSGIGKFNFKDGSIFKNGGVHGGAGGTMEDSTEEGHGDALPIDDGLLFLINTSGGRIFKNGGIHGGAIKDSSEEEHDDTASAAASISAVPSAAVAAGAGKAVKKRARVEATPDHS